MAITEPVVTEHREDVTRALAEWAARTRARDVPDEVMTVATHCLLDWAGVTLGGVDEAGPVMVRAEVREQGGHHQATLLGTGDRVNVMQAALANGIASHALDFDDVHAVLSGHPTVAVMSAVAPLAEHRGASGEELLNAFVTGVEVACRVGQYVGPAHYQRGWHATATVGALGAAAGAARLLGLDAEATARAIALAASQTGGLKSMFGTMCKPLHAGRAASTGVFAAQLAARGFTANPEGLECAQGFNATFGGAGDAEGALADLGVPRHLRDVLFKYHAACYGTHAGIDALARLREERALAAENVERVDLHVPEANLAMCNIAEPSTGLQAKFSMRFTAAMALSGTPTGDSRVFDDALCQRPELVALRDRVHVHKGSEGFSFGAEAVVHMSDGVVHRLQADAGIPEPDLARQGERLRAKFSLLAEPVLGARTAAVAERLLGMQAEPEVGAVLKQCVSD